MKNVSETTMPDGNRLWDDGFGELFSSHSAALTSHRRKADIVRRKAEAMTFSEAADGARKAEALNAALNNERETMGHTVEGAPPINRQGVTEEAQKHKVISALQYALYSVQDAISLANPYASKDTPRDLWKSGTIQEIEADLRYVIDELGK